MARRHLMDFDDFDGGGSLGDALADIVTGEQLKGLLLSGLVGGGGILGVSFIVNHLPPSVSATWKSVIGALAGLVGGRLLWGLDEDAARGFAGGVTGIGIASLLHALAPSIPAPGFSAYNPQYGWGIGQPGTKYMDYGMGRTRVEDQPGGAAPLAQFGRTRVTAKAEDEFSLGSSFGLGQDVAVGAWLS